LEIIKNFQKHPEILIQRALTYVVFVGYVKLYLKEVLEGLAEFI